MKHISVIFICLPGSNYKHLANTVALSVLIFFLALSSEARGGNGERYLSFSTAVFGILQKTNTSLEGRIEYRGLEIFPIVKPISGIMANTDGATYFYGGIVFDIQLLPFLYLSPSIAPGIYYQSNSKNLDFIIEFRSQFELALLLDNDVRVGLSFNHISNASLGPTNPGVESIAISYYFPF
jgi:lipid A 3-O-deacylase